MKFQIDTSAKVIKVEQKFNLKELLKVVKSMFPDDWEDYDIDTNSVINWNWPITNCGTCWYRNRYTQPYWITNPYIYCGTTDDNSKQWNLSTKPITNGYIQTNLKDQPNTILTYTSDALNIINVETKDNGTI